MHFFLLGLILFIVYAQVAPAKENSQRIVISHALQVELIRQFETIWQRPPSQQEQIGLIDNYLQDEILYREGLALGLDKNDIIIKRRLRQKLEVIIEEQDSSNISSDQQLMTFMQDNAALFLQPAQISFEQIIFNPDDFKAQLSEVLGAAKIALKQGAEPGELGSKTTLTKKFELQSTDYIKRDFGEEFLQATQNQNIGEWQGPVKSPYGIHLLRVNQRIDSYLPALQQVRQQVVREWESQRRQQSSIDNFARMKQNYEVIIEPPKTVTQ